MPRRFGPQNVRYTNAQNSIAHRQPMEVRCTRRKASHRPLNYLPAQAPPRTRPKGAKPIPTCLLSHIRWSLIPTRAARRRTILLAFHRAKAMAARPRQANKRLPSVAQNSTMALAARSQPFSHPASPNGQAAAIGRTSGADLEHHAKFAYAVRGSQLAHRKFFH